jgi:hypothetical protein
MTGSMARLGNDRDAWQGFAGGQQAGPVGVSRDGRASQLDEAAVLIRGGASQGSLIAPEPMVVLVHHKFRIWKHCGAGAVDQAADVVGVQVCAQHRIDVGWCNAQSEQVIGEVAGEGADRTAKS